MANDPTPPAVALTTMGAALVVDAAYLHTATIRQPRQLFSVRPDGTVEWAEDVTAADMLDAGNPFASSADRVAALALWHATHPKAEPPGEIVSPDPRRDALANIVRITDGQPGDVAKVVNAAALAALGAPTRDPLIRELLDALAPLMPSDTAAEHASREWSRAHAAYRALVPPRQLTA